MKKILVALAVLFVINLGCKKMDNGGNLCACSPIRSPELSLAIKNAAGVDLLDNKNAGGYTKDNIQVYKKDANGQITQLAFAIRPPFSYGNKKFNYYSLYYQLSFSQGAVVNPIYLKLGNSKEYKLVIQLQQGKGDTEKLMIDDKETQKEADLTQYLSMFYLTE